MSMLKFILKRILQLLPVLFGVLTLTFFLSRMMPGDPVLPFLPQRFSIDDYNAKLHELGLDKPLLEQYFIYLGNLFSGNWGLSASVSNGEPVWNLIMQRFPRTFDIALFSIIIAAFIGIKTGKISATNRNKPKDTILRGLALVGVSIPVFWLGMLLQYLVANPNTLKIFPGIGFKDMAYGDPPFVTGERIIDSLLSGHFDYIIDYIVHLILPVFCLSFITLASITRQTRSSMLEVLEQDYIRTARAKGCTEDTVINTHALRNSLIPTVTVIGLDFAGLLGGAMLTETTFNLVGIGQLLVQAIRLSDYWVLNATIFLITILFVCVNLVVDVIYGILDPRIRY